MSYQNENFVMMPVPASMFAAVCAVLGGGVSVAALASGGAGKPATEPKPNTTTEKPASGDGPQATALKDAGFEAAGAAAGDAAPAGDANEVDAAGWPWSADLHAATKGKTKDGLWRMKVGVSRPDPKPGFPKTDAAPTAGAPASERGTASAPSTPAATATDEDDEFAAFRAAADKSNATDAAAAASAPARKWTDADLGALCNQAAVKLGDPAPVKAIIAEHVPEGQVPHSRNIPEDRREAFAQAVEAKADIKFAG